MADRFAGREPALGEAARVRDTRQRPSFVQRLVRTWAPLPFASEAANDSNSFSPRDLAMQGIDVFLDTYVRIDEGTAVLLCSHRASVRTAAWMYVALATRGAEPETVCFETDNDEADAAVAAAIFMLRARAGVRRVAVIVCEPGGPSLQRALEEAQGARPERTPIFRICGRGTGIFEMGFAAGSAKSRQTGGLEAFSPEALLDDEANEADVEGLSQSDIDELLSHCDTEMSALEDRDIEEIAAMVDEDIGAMSDEELAALAELEDSELLELATAWGEEGFRVLA